MIEKSEDITSEITVKYQPPPRQGNGYSLVVASELITALEFGDISVERFCARCSKAIRKYRETHQ